VYHHQLKFDYRSQCGITAVSSVLPQSRGSDCGIVISSRTVNLTTHGLSIAYMHKSYFLDYICRIIGICTGGTGTDARD
jgi:hypothetical protein